MEWGLKSFFQPFDGVVASVHFFFGKGLNAFIPRFLVFMKHFLDFLRKELEIAGQDFGNS